MADFDPAVDRLLKIEGGYAPRDNGAGAVNFGITERFLRQIGSTLDPQRMTREQAADLYLRYFWVPYHLADFGSQRLAEAFFITLVNVPPKVAVRALQRAVNDAQQDTGRPPLTADGLLGRFTLSTLNVADACGVLDRFKAHVLEHYEHLAQADPAEYGDDLPGWKRRLEAL